MSCLRLYPVSIAFLVCLVSCGQVFPESPELILHNGKIVTVDEDFWIAEAVSVRGNKFLRVGSSQDPNLGARLVSGRRALLFLAHAPLRSFPG